MAYYLRLARRTEGPVLEYGIGNGRIGLELARAGCSVTGIDLSRPMLEDLRQKLRHEPASVQKRVSLHRGDMRSVEVGRRFPLVLATFNTVLHLYSQADFERFFARVRRHLAPGGRFVFDFTLPDVRELALDPSRAHARQRFRHPVTGALLTYCERYRFDPIQQVLVTSMQFEDRGGRRYVVSLSQRQLFPAEVVVMLGHAGFHSIRARADFTTRRLDPFTETVVVSARAGGGGMSARGLKTRRR